VFEDALACFQKQFVTEGRRVQRMAQEAEEWFLSDDTHWPFSFVSVRAVLGLERESVRQQLKRWSHSHLNTPQRNMQNVKCQRKTSIAEACRLTKERPTTLLGRTPICSPYFCHPNRSLASLGRSVA